MLQLLLLATSLAPAPQAPQDEPPPPVQRPAPPPIPADTEVVTTASGLKYSVLQEGDGSPSPRKGDLVRVHYTGWLTDGTPFDSSRERGEPSEFALGAVIEGWTEALMKMSPGARWKLTIPPELAYGEQGSPPTIPANATLVFDVELLSIPARHAMEFVPWGGEGGRTTESGLSFRTLVEGTGEPLVKLPAGDGDGAGAAQPVPNVKALWLEFALWTEEGKLLINDLMAGRPLVMSPDRPQLGFLKEILPHAKSGALLIARVPVADLPELSGLEELDPEGYAIWQLRIVTTSNFAKPEFALPPPDELTTTASGLQYKVLREGSQLHPTLANRVTAHYAGWLTDGTPFDASYDREQPMTTPLTNLIRGWQEGMQRMGRGAVFLFVVPAELGYGAQDKGDIPPNSTLVFVVELIDFG